MASIAASVAALKSFGASMAPTIAGSYTLKEFFDLGVPNVPLPALLAVPELGQQTGWQTLAFMGQAPQLTFSLDHYLLFKSVGGTEDFTYVQPDMVDKIDAYFVALKANPLLTNAGVPGTHFAPQVSFKIQRTKWGDTQFHSVIFRYELGLML